MIKEINDKKTLKINRDKESHTLRVTMTNSHALA